MGPWSSDINKHQSGIFSFMYGPLMVNHISRVILMLCTVIFQNKIAILMRWFYRWSIFVINTFLFYPFSNLYKTISLHFIFHYLLNMLYTSFSLHFSMCHPSDWYILSYCLWFSELFQALKYQLIISNLQSHWGAFSLLSPNKVDLSLGSFRNQHVYLIQCLNSNSRQPIYFIFIHLVI